MSKGLQQNSRLGRVLVNKGFISEAQLDQALVVQGETGNRLGEVLVSMGCLSEKQLASALKRQANLRKAAVVVTSLCAPFYSVTSLAASSVASPILPTVRAEFSGDKAPNTLIGLKAISDDEMREVSAQGFIAPVAVAPSMGHDAYGAGFMHKYDDDREDDEQQDEEQIAQQLMDTVLTFSGMGPISSLLDGDLSVEGLHFAEGRPRLSVLPDGGVRFYMPDRIERINYENIRVKGSEDPATFGSIYMSDITFAPGSNYTIRARN